MSLKRLVILTLLAAAVLAAPAPARALPPVRHVFVVFLENKNYVETFGANTDAKYFSGEVARAGQLLTQYYATGHLSLDNYISIVSGQAPNPVTQSDCQFFQDFAMAGTTADGQAIGQGCVYPKSVQTIADQLEAKGLTWKGYMEDMGAPCRHPQIGARDDTQSAKVGDQYAARHNPFVYFHSIIDEPSCAQNDVPLDRLPADLADPARTANFTFITPNLCNDGHDAPCVDGKPGGLKSADAWLQQWIPRIVGSPAFKKDGLLLITFDEAEATGSSADAAACCNEQPGPNTPNPGGTTPGPGGGRVGAVVLSPFVRPGTMNGVPYNHYGFLRTIEDLFGLEHLGYAGQDGLKPFGDDVFGRPHGAPVSLGGTAGGANATGPSTAPGACKIAPLPAAQDRRLPRGSLIASARITRERPGDRATLVVTATRAARLYVRSGGGARIGAPRIARCGRTTTLLPAGHGQVRVAMSIRGGTERRTLRY